MVCYSVVNSKSFAAPAVLLLAFYGLPFAAPAQSAVPAFALHDGDRVTFYGDSITAQREYTEDVEEFVLTRFPSWKVRSGTCMRRLNVLPFPQRPTDGQRRCHACRDAMPSSDFETLT